MADKGDPPPIFALFNEIGIINQLAAALFESRLPPGVLVSHFSVLNHLIRVRDGATPLQLANAFQVPKTTMTHTLAGLETHVDFFQQLARSAAESEVFESDHGRYCK